MKYLPRFLLVACAGILCLSGCDDSRMSTANSERTRTPMNTMGGSANSVGSAMNSTSNAVSGTTAASAESFMREAAQGGMAEVEMGKLAEQKSKNAEIKNFGRMMVKDHSDAGKELMALASKKNITLPTDMGTHKSTYNRLNGLSGADFDTAYVDEMTADHQKDVSAFQTQADNATDPEVKAFAAKVLPLITKHMEVIKEMQAKMQEGR
jgi:putative membrane protein